MGVLSKRICNSLNAGRFYCVTAPGIRDHWCKVLVVGGGTGGCSVVWRFADKLKAKEVILLEPSQVHYYQPMFTLVAAGVRGLAQSRRPLPSVLPRNVAWLRDHAEEFDPANCVVYTRCGHKISYEYMVVAMGLENDYEKILGLRSALDNPSSCVSTIYSPKYCCKTWRCLQDFRGGHALFTFPSDGGKCAGAAQMIMYLADDYWRQNKVRQDTSITYVTGAGKTFGVPKYETALTRVASSRDVTVNCQAGLVGLSERGAVVELGGGGGKITLPYNFLHVTPPMRPPASLRTCDTLVTAAGFLDVDKFTLQHVRHPNVFGIGDCTNTPNSKTAAAIGPQSHVLAQNLASTMAGKKPTAKYNGYGACHMLTSYKKGIMAEFLYDKQLCETFPFDQSRERLFFSLYNKHYLPYLYWNKLIKGKWNGPSKLRTVINPFGR